MGTGDESGFTVIEVLVAALLLAIGIFAALNLFDVSTRATLSAQRNQIAVDRAQREIEDLRRLDYDQVALTSAPATSTDANDPRHRVSGSSFETKDGDTSSYSDLVINGQTGVSNGLFDPGPTSFSAGGVTGKIYRFVVWQNDPKCGTCAGTHDFRRAIVAVKLDPNALAGGARRYVEIQADFTNPEEGVQGSAPPPSSDNKITAQQFHLTDTPCSSTTRQAIVDDVETSPQPQQPGHLLHNTLGPCSAGRKTGSTPGAPDLLDLDAPSDPTPADDSDPPLYDYATDLEPVASPIGDPQNLADKGLQLRKPDNPGCAFAPQSPQESSPPQIVHRWLTPPLPSGYAVTGSATLRLWTRTLNQTPSQPAKLCVYLFIRTSGGTDTPLVDSTTGYPYFTYSRTAWPDGTASAEKGFGLVSEPMSFAQQTVATGSSLGVAIGEERSGTSSDIEAEYDDPELDSYLELGTTTPLANF
jgi:type II secretory pathway pseudopilin PulG